jgi:4-hydroxy-4-methyl-2-oxoglutarate aldolase
MSKPIIKQIQRPSENLLRKFEGLPSALLHEAMGKRGALNHEVKPVYPGAVLVGTALTIRSFPGDNLMLHLAISLAKPGDVLVAAVGGYTEAGLWGEIASEAAIAQQICGLVTDGAVRDVAAISRLGFPVFARGVCIKGTAKLQAGLINHPISIAGELVHPGDIIVGDDDGVVVVPSAEAETVLEAAHKIEKREARIIDAIKQDGALTLDLLNLRATIHELGLDQE